MKKKKSQKKIKILIRVRADKARSVEVCSEFESDIELPSTLLVVDFCEENTIYFSKFDKQNSIIYR